MDRVDSCKMKEIKIENWNYLRRVLTDFSFHFHILAWLSFIPILSSARRRVALKCSGAPCQIMPVPWCSSVVVLTCPTATRLHWVNSTTPQAATRYCMSLKDFLQALLPSVLGCHRDMFFIHWYYTRITVFFPIINSTYIFCADVQMIHLYALANHHNPDLCSVLLPTHRFVLIQIRPNTQCSALPPVSLRILRNILKSILTFHGQHIFLPELYICSRTWPDITHCISFKTQIKTF